MLATPVGYADRSSADDGAAPAQQDWEADSDDTFATRQTPFDGLSSRLPMLTFRFCGVVLLMSVAVAANATCRCPEAASSSHLLVRVPPAVPGQSGLVACGCEDERHAETVVASEFQIFRCGSSRPLLEFGALQTAHLRPVGAALEIVEVERWPFGAGWKWIDVPVYQLQLTAKGFEPNHRRTLRLRPAVRPPEVSKFLQEYTQWLSTPSGVRSYASAEELVARLFTATVAGDQGAEKLFLRMRDDAGLDGGAAEVYSMAVQTYVAWKQTRIRSPKE
jgi:hypothetical protein